MVNTDFGTGNIFFEFLFGIKFDQENNVYKLIIEGYKSIYYLFFYKRDISNKIGNFCIEPNTRYSKFHDVFVCSKSKQETLKIKFEEIHSTNLFGKKIGIFKCGENMVRNNYCFY